MPIAPERPRGFAANRPYWHPSESREEGADVGQRIYIGQMYDGQTSFLCLNAPYYFGSQGQFLSEDPVFLSPPNQQHPNDPQSLNAYSYSDDNPIAKSDPTGKDFGLPVPVAFPVAWGAGNERFYVRPQEAPSDDQVIFQALANNR